VGPRAGLDGQFSVLKILLSALHNSTKGPSVSGLGFDVERREISTSFIVKLQL